MAQNSSGSKYLLNELEHNVRENLIGLAMSNPAVQIAPPPVDAIIRKDIEQCIEKGQTLLVSGGGAGHEPMFAGFVGPKCLSAAISGSYFASPSAGSIVRLVQLIAPDPKTPILLLTANYTGDRLNFGLAKERLAMIGYKNIGWFVFGDDLAPYISGYPVSGHDLDVKRRGLAGIVFLHKIAGTLSERGKSLSEIQKFISRLPKLTYTLSVSLSPADIPGRGPSFQLGTDQMELGLGVHGESGVRRIKQLSAAKTVKLLLDEMISRLQKLSPNGPLRLAVIVNNLGGLIAMEMNIILKEIIEQSYQIYNVCLERIYHGPFFTSFNMSGVSISMMIVDDELLDILDDSDRVPEKSKSINIEYEFVGQRPGDEIGYYRDECQRKLFEIINPELYKRLLVEACNSLISAETKLNELDKTVGDGDCGSTLAAMAKLFLERIRLSNQNEIGQPTFSTLSRIVTHNIGGSSGAMYSLLLTSGHNFVESHAGTFGQNPIKFWMELVRHCIDKLSIYGGAKIGYRSMLDSLNGIILGLDNFMKQTGYDGRQSLKPDQLLLLTQTVSRFTKNAANSTANMRAVVGRARYVDENLVKGRLDPGAVAVSIWVDAIMATLPNILTSTPTPALASPIPTAEPLSPAPETLKQASKTPEADKSEN